MLVIVLLLFAPIVLLSRLCVGGCLCSRCLFYGHSSIVSCSRLRLAFVLLCFVPIVLWSRLKSKARFVCSRACLKILTCLNADTATIVKY